MVSGGVCFGWFFSCQCGLLLVGLNFISHKQTATKRWILGMLNRREKQPQTDWNAPSTLIFALVIAIWTLAKCKNSMQIGDRFNHWWVWPGKAAYFSPDYQYFKEQWDFQQILIYCNAIFLNFPKYQTVLQQCEKGRVFSVILGIQEPLWLNSWTLIPSFTKTRLIKLFQNMIYCQNKALWILLFGVN